MRYVAIFSLLVVTAFSLSACGSKEENKADFYESCALTFIQSNQDYSFCIESKNSTGLKVGCDEKKGVYSQTQCAVMSSTKGCSYTENSVAVTEWYIGAAYTPETVTSSCAGKKGVVVTK